MGNKNTTDHCFAAKAGDEVIGLVWVRLLNGKIKGYGNIDDTTPEFSLSVKEKYRKKGVATKLMTTMLAFLKKQGYKKASLSVQKENFACNFYRKLGFEVIKENSEDYIMAIVF